MRLLHPCYRTQLYLLPLGLSISALECAPFFCTEEGDHDVFNNWEQKKGEVSGCRILDGT